MFKVRDKNTGKIIYDSLFCNGDDWLFNFMHNIGDHQWVMIDITDDSVDISNLTADEKESYDEEISYMNWLNTLKEDDLEIDFANEYHHKTGFTLDRFWGYMDTYRETEYNDDW